jgi:hypothetical protein
MKRGERFICNSSAMVGAIAVRVSFADFALAGCKPALLFSMAGYKPALLGC